jgi:hypothetical protein
MAFWVLFLRGTKQAKTFEEWVQAQLTQASFVPLERKLLSRGTLEKYAGVDFPGVNFKELQC